MSYIAKKVCSFGGENFGIGDMIPDALVHPGRVADLIKIGVIDTIGNGAEDMEQYTAPLFVPITIHAQEGDLELKLSLEEVQTVFDVLHDNTEGAKEKIATITKEDPLILIDATETRKGVKTFLHEHVKAIFPPTEEE